MDAPSHTREQQAGFLKQSVEIVLPPAHQCPGERRKWWRVGRRLSRELRATTAVEHVAGGLVQLAIENGSFTGGDFVTREVP